MMDGGASAASAREPAAVATDRHASIAEVVALASATAAIHDADGTFPSEVFDLLAARGLLLAPLAVTYGGWGLGGRRATAWPLLRLLRDMGYGNLSVGRVYEGHVNALQLIQTFGKPAHIARWAADARDGCTFAVWNTEADDGVRLTPLGARRYRLDGAKTFASGAGYVRRPIVPGALPDGGWQMCVVPLERVGVSIDSSWWQPLGMRASVSARVDFTGVVLDADDLLGTPGDYHRQPWLAGGAVRFAAVQLGGAAALLDATRAFLRELGRTGDPYQRARVGQGALLVESGHHWLRAATEQVDLAPDADRQPEISRSLAYAALTRTAIESICMDVIQLAERSAGARAMLHPQPIERILRDLTHYLRQPAPDAALASAGAFVLERAEASPHLWSEDR
jgi:alkylation response protein AidB-like acyl-CoA dehydrogenase